MPTVTASVFSAVFAALLTAHHLGDQWIQTHHQALRKGDRTREGQWACLAHVTTYTITTLAAVLAVTALLDLPVTPLGIAVGQAFSAVSHYAIDRRWTLAWLADRIGKREYHDLGRPRPQYQVQAVHQVTVPTRGGTYHSEPRTVTVPLDVTPAVTGAYSLDQALHLPALCISALLTALI